MILWTMVGMGVVTYLPRLIPTLFLSGRSLHPLITGWLRLVPPAVLAAMLAPSLMVSEGNVDLSFDNLYFWAALIAFPVAWRFNSLSATVLIGMGLVAAGRYFYG